MSRFLTIGNIRRVGQFLCKNQISNNAEWSNCEALVGPGLCSRQYKLYSQCTSPSRRLPEFAIHGTRNGNCNSYFKHFSSAPASNTLAHHTQVTWKRLLHWALHSGRSLLPISRIAQAVSLALCCSYVVIPGIFALNCGSNVAWAQAVSDIDIFQPTNYLYASAQDGHVFLTSLILSMLEGISLLLRALFLAVLFAPTTAMAPFADSFGPEFRKLWLRAVHQTLERADLCIELGKLQTKAPEHSFDYTKKTIERAFGHKISEIFDDFEEEPVASGSIAQVHRASLRSRYHGCHIKPMLVAVKVRHPGVGDSIKRDFEIINIVAKISNCIPTLKWLRLDESVQQFSVFMMSQVDLAREAAHLSRFIYNFRRSKNVSFPKPVYPLVHPAVLVETFEHGESVSHYVDELHGNEQIKSALAHIGTNALLKMLLVTY
ncbi:probable serine threonine- kinase abkC [Olea europaea subsp. europaea]|uniref:Probable serine threonine- kinase abkC n=1 Tax=Olea europaea subsp. europaea TaxID=158383 RepID=A0A8S0VL64_OLEEU|nr:probable serine threonine- kinase abkC [Olea europaea subsp. europaea]